VGVSGGEPGALSTFTSPLRYVQGPDAVFAIGEHSRAFGDSALVVGGRSGLAATRDGRARGFEEHMIRQSEELFGGESSEREIGRLLDIARAGNYDFFVASGGGKVIDAVKLVAAEMKAPCVIVPTVASNDAPCSSLSVIYNDDGSFARLVPHARNPDLVLVDTAIIARSPVRHLVSGMGDALATWYEADACRRSGAKNVTGGSATLAALAIARLCRDTLFEDGTKAAEACRNNAVTPALERVTEANILLSGIGFESAGVALAHALSEGLSAVPALHGRSHGETVAFGLIVQLVLEGKPRREIDEVIRFCRDVGLPTTLRELGADGGKHEQLQRAAEITVEPGKPSGNMPSPVTTGSLLHAIIEADTLGWASREGYNDNSRV
jgi:glycerol dehydrogenase